MSEPLTKDKVFTTEYLKDWLEESEKDLPDTESGNLELDRRTMSEWINTKSVTSAVALTIREIDILDEERDKHLERAYGKRSPLEDKNHDDMQYYLDGLFLRISKIIKKNFSGALKDERQH